MRSVNCFLSWPAKPRFAQDRLGVLALNLGKQLIVSSSGNTFGAFGFLL
ncbi:hypothetical protein KDW09_20585 [Burkholderia cenocepacia]|jgi:hypothetical protein|nr:hypothetical protein [Burkholderia cenocepacia]HEB3533593.1 hypothetical protein [Burkholderia cenocepacia]